MRFGCQSVLENGYVVLLGITDGTKTQESSSAFLAVAFLSVFIPLALLADVGRVAWRGKLRVR